jgi:hypothetical protein
MLVIATCRIVEVFIVLDALIWKLAITFYYWWINSWINTFGLPCVFGTLLLIFLLVGLSIFLSVYLGINLFVCIYFWDKGLLWPGTCDPSALDSWVLGLLIDIGVFKFAIVASVCLSVCLSFSLASNKFLRLHVVVQTAGLLAPLERALCFLMLSHQVSLKVAAISSHLTHCLAKFALPPFAEITHKLSWQNFSLTSSHMCLSKLSTFL